MTWAENSHFWSHRGVSWRSERLLYLRDNPGFSASARTLSYHLGIGDSYLHQNTKDLVVSHGYSSILNTISYKYFEIFLKELNRVLAYWRIRGHLNSVQKQACLISGYVK